MQEEVFSWGHTVRSTSQIDSLEWRGAPFPKVPPDQTLLAHGCGRSYGDSCLNDRGRLLLTHRLNHLIAFDAETGRLRCEAGTTLDEILELFVPRGFFIPVTLGTKFISVGGAVANDVHGKNHHRVGTFGCVVRRLELLRSTGERIECSAEQNRPLFQATIGGLGLTGLILWVEFDLQRIESAFVDVEEVRFRSIEEYFSQAQHSDGEFAHTSAWIDLFNRGRSFGQGVLFRGNFSSSASRDQFRIHEPPIHVPWRPPNWFLNSAVIAGFNRFYLLRHTRDVAKKKVHYDPFFFPLDRAGSWSRLYGKRGFFQYQCILPKAEERDSLKELMELIRKSPSRPYLAVLKTFGPIRSPGILSFPIPGTTLALDFPNQGKTTRQVMDRLDDFVGSAGGRVYPAKDARMSKESFRRYFPSWQDFSNWVDPKLSSNFWRRMTTSA